MILILKKMQAGRNIRRRTLDCKVLRPALYCTNGTGYCQPSNPEKGAKTGIENDPGFDIIERRPPPATCARSPGSVTGAHPLRGGIDSEDLHQIRNLA